VATIGAILPLSSPGAFLAGYAMQTAINIAVTEINEQGGVQGVPVRLVTYDSAGIPERSAQFTERLILLDCALAVVGLYHNGDALAAIDVAHRYGVPIIIAEAGADDITARGYPEVFRIAPTHSMLAQAPTSWLKEVGDYNADGELTAAIIAENVTKMPTMIEIMHTSLIDSGIATELLRVDLPSTDFSSAIARLVALEQLPDAIFITVKGEPALRLQSQLLEAGISPQRSTLIVQAHSGLDSAQFWGEVPNGNGTVVLRVGAWSSTLTERGNDFAIKYDQIMGRWPESYAFSSYDALWLLATTLNDAPEWSGSELVTTLEQVEVPSTSGPIHFAVNSSATITGSQPAYLWHQWAGGQILYLQYTEANQAANTMAVIWPPAYREPNLETAVISTTP
jgi:branched-chain amino acid transport system substrate-binding protein